MTSHPSRSRPHSPATIAKAIFDKRLILPAEFEHVDFEHRVAQAITNERRRQDTLRESLAAMTDYAERYADLSEAPPGGACHKDIMKARRLLRRTS